MGSSSLVGVQQTIKGSTYFPDKPLRSMHQVMSSILTTKAAVDLDKAVRTFDEGTTWHHRHFFIDQMNCHCQPLLLIHFVL